MFDEFDGDSEACVGLGFKESRDSFGPSNEYQYDEEGGGISVWSTFGSVYPGGGFIEVIPVNVTTANDQAEELKANYWIDQNTRFVTVTLVNYNINLNLFCLSKFFIEIPPTGMIVPYARIQTVKALRWGSSSSSSSSSSLVTEFFETDTKNHLISSYWVWKRL